MKNMGHERSIADPCMYFFSNKNCELAMWLSWVDDNLIVGPPQVMKNEGKNLVKEIKIDEKEFVQCNVKIGKLEWSEKFTQPVMIQSFLDELSTGKRSEWHQQNWKQF